MTEGSGAEATRRWRDKYLDLLDRHEKLKRNQEHQHEQMRRGLVMVSLLAQGQAGTIDSSLHDLRNALKNGSTLHRILDDLERAVHQYEDLNLAQAEVLLGQISDAAEKLGQCPLPRELQKRIKDVQKNAGSELKHWSGYIRQLQNWIQIVGEIATLEGHEDARQNKWWQRWFKPAEQPTEEVIAKEVEASEPGFSHIAQDVSDTLLNLLAQLVVPERLNYQSQSLQQRLQQGLNWFELVPLLEDTTEFLLQCLGNSQAELENFLHSLDQRLQAIRILVSEASAGQADRKQAREALDSMVREQIADIRSVVTGSGDLGELGVSVRDHLMLIVEAMDKYQREEDEREQRLAEKLELLQKRLNEMEQEVSDSRIAIEEQRRRASHDTLTGLPNRDAYQKKLEEELARRHRYGSPLSLVVCDVDHFKSINDTYGHLAGDKVLQLIARSLRKNLRDVDFIARYGGEEFVILMPETNAEGALLAAEKLRQTVENIPFNFRKERVPITLSFGISEFHSLESPDTVFERADKALYKAKHEGRNRSCMA
ncbi:GGDEF domain-containing protein [Venatoribacter cucullus]|uniref:GGDEF domain-containing protein n=1 Tax=Venatoribacter cucullus TaxID=2661630 RepID=UPI002240A8C9|nr:GGDEF domain-containing protein [Venatoribacter cucullus]UZK02449.1 diguanylate cyclase [Venatoribacter cucullus]